jgi:hypothetical protein
MSRVRCGFAFDRMISRRLYFFVTVWSGQGSTCVQSMIVSIRHYLPVIVLPDGCTVPLWLKIK